MLFFEFITVLIRGDNNHIIEIQKIELAYLISKWQMALSCHEFDVITHKFSVVVMQWISLIQVKN